METEPSSDDPNVTEREGARGGTAAGDTVDSADPLRKVFSFAATDLSVRPPPEIPDHELIRSIGRGGYGEVWLAKNVLGEYRAVKIVYRDAFDHYKPYEREFEGLKKFEPISHARESQVDIFHVGKNDTAGFFYYVMELADDAGGEPSLTNIDRSTHSRLGDPSSYSPRTLKHDLRSRGGWPVAEALQIALSLARALEHLNAHGLVHRDIKPSNIIFVRGVPKLADIGLVTSIDATRSFVGTDGYIPPEGPGTPQADLYSLGKVLYEVLTGKDRLEFPELPGEWRTQPDFNQLLEFNEVLTKACDDNPDLRYQTVAELEADLALLDRGKSIMQQRKREACWAIALRGTVILTGAVVIVAVALLTVRGIGNRRLFSSTGPSPNLGRLDEGASSTNSMANELYTRAMYYMRADDDAHMGEVYTNFLNATRLDPHFAKAYAALFEMLIREQFPGGPAESPEQLRRLAAKLKELAPGMAATFTAQSFVHWMDRRFDEALKSCERAIQINPNYELAHTHYGVLLTLLGQLEPAHEQLLKAEELEPAKAVIQGVLGNYYWARRDYTNAIDRYNRALRFKDYTPSHLWLGRIYEALGEYEQAIGEWHKLALAQGESKSETKARCDGLSLAFRQGGERGYWLEKLQQTLMEAHHDYYWEAAIHAHLGNTNDAFICLRKSLELGEADDPGWWHCTDGLLLDAYWDGLREDQRFKKLLEDAGLVKTVARR